LRGHGRKDPLRRKIPKRRENDKNCLGHAYQWYFGSYSKKKKNNAEKGKEEMIKPKEGENRLEDQRVEEAISYTQKTKWSVEWPGKKKYREKKN